MGVIMAGSKDSVLEAPQAIFITHLKQKHSAPEFERNLSAPSQARIKEEIVYSQFQTALTILRSKDSIVLLEGLNEDLTEDNRNLQIGSEVGSEFKEGFPDRYDLLTVEQKKLLYEFSGPEILFYLGELSNIYKTETMDVTQRIVKMLNETPRTEILKPACMELILGVREKCAIECVKLAALTSKNEHVLMVFGARHDFEETIKALNDKTIVFKGSIDTRLSAKQKEANTAAIHSRLVQSIESTVDKKEASPLKEKVVVVSRVDNDVKVLEEPHTVIPTITQRKL